MHLYISISLSVAKISKWSNLFGVSSHLLKYTEYQYLSSLDPSKCKAKSYVASMVKSLETPVVSRVYRDPVWKHITTGF
jgi:hypothetical protein